MKKKPATKQKPKPEIEEICHMIIDGKTYRQIAEYYGINLLRLHAYLSEDKGRYTRAREALTISADTYADQAEQVLIDAAKDGIEMQRARELSSFYKWKAAKRRPKDYGDKVDVTTQGEKITAAPPDLTHLSFEQLKELQRGAKGGK